MERRGPPSSTVKEVPLRSVNEENRQVVPGARVKLAADWGELRAGEQVVVSRLDGPGLVVRLQNGKEEFWIPASLVPNSSTSRAWSFRPRRIDSPEKSCGKGNRNRNRNDSGSGKNRGEEARERMVGLRGVDYVGNELNSSAFENCARPGCLEENDEDRENRGIDGRSLEVELPRSIDSEIRDWSVEREKESRERRISRYVVGGDNDRAAESTEVQCRNEGKIDSLIEDESIDWEAKQFLGRYLQLEELGSGRFARVHRARDRGTGQEVALKQISTSKQQRSITRAEYDLLRSTRHTNVLRAFALFENAPRPGIDTIILELIEGPTLFTYLVGKVDYTETMVTRYAREILSGLQWLHSRGRAHLDLKPENVLVDLKTGHAKLIDLGEAAKAAPLDKVGPPADLEFAAPELVLGKPTGFYTDMWAVGVFFYVLLSGLSPFLDDSVEETTANILKCDFCFPEEYFGTVSREAKGLLEKLLRSRSNERASADESLASTWFEISKGATIPSSRMAAFVERRAHGCSKTFLDRNGG